MKVYFDDRSDQNEPDHNMRMNESDHINKSEERDYIQEHNQGSRAIRQPNTMSDLYEQYDITHTQDNRLKQDVVITNNEDLLNQDS
jgi:hypothetical protein